MLRVPFVFLLALLLFLRDEPTFPDPVNHEAFAAHASAAAVAEVPPTVDGIPRDLRPIDEYFPLQSQRRAKFSVAYHSALRDGHGQTTSVTEGGIVRHAKEYHRITFESSGVPGLDKVVLYFRLAEQGLFQLRDDGPAATESLLIPRLLKIGDRWEVHDGRYSARCQVLGLETIVCHGLRFEDCLRLRIDSDGLLGRGSEQRWLAPGLGTVKQTYSGKWFSFDSELAALPTNP